jgi:hypothetical protein
MVGHLALDVVVAAGFAASPWLFGFAKRGRKYWLPHVLVGATKATIALTMKAQPPDRPIEK